MPKFNTLKVRDIKKETSECVSVAFEVPEQLIADYAFIQGQYLTLKAEIKGEEVRRSYSICTSPLDNDLRVAIKKVEGGRFSTFANEQLEVGDALEVMTPMGRFYTQLDANNENNYVAFAAGSGITPVMSILKTALQREPKSNFMLFYGNRATDSIIFKEEIEALKNIFMGRLSVHHVLSRELQDSPLFTGRIDAEKCMAFSKTFFDPDEVDAFFLCGPGVMIEEVSNQLLERGVDKSNIHFELFTTDNVGALNLMPEKKTMSSIKEDVEATIAITLDGNSFSFPLLSKGDNILDAALKAGADLPFSCKGGVCATCRAKVIKGQVNMDVNYALEQDELEKGYVLTCQAHPASAEVHVDFDS